MLSHLYPSFCEWGASDHPGYIKQPPDREQAGRPAATSAQLASELPNNPKHVTVPFAVALWLYHM